jgi:hypothetical protein
MVVIWGWFGAGFNSHQKSTLLGTSLFSISLIDYILLDLLVDSGLFSQITDKEDKNNLFFTTSMIVYGTSFCL